MLDLKSDPQLIAAYEKWHQPKQVFPEVTKSIRESGILSLEIYRLENRLVMLMETTEEFSFAQKESNDAQQPAVQEWENLMWTFQEPLPWAPPGTKWMLANKIYDLKEQ
jgi:L-rhamnose mutarotase